MAELVTDCPRCRAKRTTFDVFHQVVVGREHGWQLSWEAFSVCRHCHRSTVFIVRQTRADTGGSIGAALSEVKGSLNGLVEVLRFISIATFATEPPPEHLPDAIAAAFAEGARCLAVDAPNGASTMFRLCVDLATVGRLPPEDAPDGPNTKQRRDLGLRLPWLFENKLLPDDIEPLASCIKEDGNDGAHRGTLTMTDAQELLDFTRELLERLSTTPARTKIAADRRAARKSL